jgi:hypothetical protein
MYINPSVSDFKSYFTRDFPYSSNPNIGVLDSDIFRAIMESTYFINPDLFEDQINYSTAFYLLAAHNLVTNIQNSSQGLGSSYSWLTNNKSVGAVSEGFAIPQRILDNPEFAALAKTGYGMKYLTMVLPLLSGSVFVVCGKTLP